MASNSNAPRSRRAILSAAAGAAAAVAASAAIPAGVAADDPNDVAKNQDNATTAQTSVTQGAGGSVAFKARTVNTDAAALIGSTGNETDPDFPIADDTSFTGVYGWSEAAPIVAPPATQYEGSGVWGDSPDDGVVGTGGLTGVLGLGGDGVVGIGDGDGVVGVGGATGAGVRAIGASPTSVGLAVTGKVLFSRAGRSTIGTGKSSLKVTLSGVTSSSRVFAVLHSNRSGRYVRAVVPTSGSFTIYLNTTVTSATFVAWFVIN
jgi:hypothetical protein